MVTVSKKTSGGKNVPKLRFPRFSEEWIIHQLKDITTYVDYRGKGPRKTEEGVFLLTAKNIKKGHIDYESSKEYVAFDDYQNVMRKGDAKIGDILFTTEAPLGNVAQLDREPIALAQRVIKFRAKTNLMNGFLLYYMLCPTFQTSILKMAIGSTVLGVSGKDLHASKVSLPTLPEQKKIADFLSTMDDWIENLKREKEQLEKYKKGMMQQLFSQKIRFKADDGKDFPEWEEKKLGEVFDEVTETVGNREIETYSITAKVGLISQKKKFGRNIAGRQNSKYVVLRPREFTYNKGNSKTYEYGCIYMNDEGKEIAVPNVFISFKLKDSLMKEWFFAKLFENHSLDKGLRKIISSSARMNGLLNLNKSHFFNLKISFPNSDEQQKISDFLLSIDTFIEDRAKQIKKAEKWKKGLMQQLFI
jgi:type I restriction enzyme S subunit